MPLEELSTLATGRTAPLFAPDLERRTEDIRDHLAGKRVLVIGGAGSIGAATIRAMATFQPRTAHVVDTDENGLAELVRDLRSGRDTPLPADFRLLPLDFGSSIMRRFLAEQAPYDYVLNFAAIKHVRSEKDLYCLLQMLATNVLKPARLLRWLAERGGTTSYFCVSTDKAANPTSLMGASKRLMEHAAFSGEAATGFAARVASARFANVAFSNGSLLQSFLQRLEKRQALAAPIETRRYFISLTEAGQICLLAALCAPSRHLLVPRLDAATDLHDLESVAVAVLRQHHLEPRRYRIEEEARAAVDRDMAQGCYPLLLTPLDTSGEKPFEEFIGSGERAMEIGLPNLLAVPYLPAPAGAVSRFLERMERLLADHAAPLRKEDLIAELSAVVPELQHRDRGKSLDDRM